MSASVLHVVSVVTPTYSGLPPRFTVRTRLSKIQSSSPLLPAGTFEASATRPAKSHPKAARRAQCRRVSAQIASSDRCSRRSVRHALALALVLLAACEPGSRSRELYVSMPAENAVIRVDPVGQRIVSRTTVGLLPHNFAFSADQRRLYVVLVGSQAVAELDSPSGALLRTILTEPVPSARADGTTIQEHIDQGAFSATTCFACHHGGAGGAKTTVVGSRPFGIVLGPDEQTLYVTNIVSGNLSSIDLASGRSTVTHLAATGDAQQPTAIALLGDDLFVTVLPVLPSFSPAVVRRLDRTTLATRAEAPTGSNSNALLADALHDELYVSNFESNTLSRFDRELAVLGKITVDSELA